MELEQQWQQFMNGGTIDETSLNFQNSKNGRSSMNKEPPKCTNLKISTKSKIIYLNQRFDLNELFWKVPIIDYDSGKEGIIKKQMKFNFTCKEQVSDFEKKIKNETCAKYKILNQIDNPSGRVIFKDVRKVDVGYCKNDLLKPNKSSKAHFIIALLLFS